MFESPWAILKLRRRSCYGCVERQCTNLDLGSTSGISVRATFVCQTFGSVGLLSRLCKEERLDEALQAVEVMDECDVPASRNVISCLLQLCSKKKDLETARRLHFVMSRSGLDSIAFWGDHLIRLFVLCGSLVEANAVFGKVSKPSVYTWNAIISAHVKFAEGERALQLYHTMKEKGSTPNRVTFLTILKACSSLQIIEQGRLIHDHIIGIRIESNLVVLNSLIDMYVKCGSLEEAHRVFDNMLSRDVVSWGTLISGYAQHGHGHCALELFKEMQKGESKPDRGILASTLKACGNIEAIGQGRLIHEQILKSGLGLECDPIIGNALVGMYGKCRSLQEARKMFDKLPNQDLVSWGAMIAGYANQGQGIAALKLFEELQRQGIKPVTVTYLCTLKACGSIGAVDQGRILHDQIIRVGLVSDLVIGNTFVDMYAKCGSLNEAHNVLNGLQKRDVVSWSAMIAGYAAYGLDHLVLELFEKMQEEGTKPSGVVVSFVLKACGNIGGIGQGKLIHGQIICDELESDGVVCNTLLDMYAKCGSLQEACHVFDLLPSRDVVSWSTMISGYFQHGHSIHALDLFEKMQWEGISPNNVLFSSLLNACSHIGVTGCGRLVHSQVIQSGLDLDIIVGNTLVHMYATYGSLDEAHKVFHKLPSRDEVSWGTIIAGYAQHGYGFHALDVSKKMHQEGIRPSEVTLLCILKACGNVGVLEQGWFAHKQIIESGYESDVVIGNTLVDMYAKCGSIEDAHEVFSKLSDRNVVSWAAMITGYAAHGCCILADQFLKDMQRQGLEPNEVIFTSILCACSYSGALEEGCQYFKRMREKHGIAPSMEHYSCMIDLLARAGNFDEAGDLVQAMPVSPDVIVWRSLLASCKTYSNVELARYCFDQVLQLDPMDASGYVLMSNIYADACMWEDADRIQELKKYAGVQKMAGKACIEVCNKMHEFIVGGKSNTLSVMVFAKSKRLHRHFKDEGYLPQLDMVMEPILDDWQDAFVC